jgi:AraC-like DNA-binding protein
MEVKVQPEMKDHILGTDIFTNSPGILLLFLVNTCLYLILTLREVKAYSEEIKLRFSSIKKITFKWICLMVYLWIALLVVFTLFFILHFFSIFPVQNVFMILRCAIACVIFVIGYFNLRYPLFYQYPINESENNEISSESYENEKSKEKNRSNISTTDYSQKKQKILQYMKEEKPYLNSNLTIIELSQNLGMHYKTLSKILNKEFGCTFYDIINKYRVNEVKEKLRDTKNTNLTIMSIAYECGFNSKSSFNTLFKKVTGKTPRDYRK